VSAENGVRENGVRENGVRGRTVSEGERCQRENGVRGRTVSGTLFEAQGLRMVFSNLNCATAFATQGSEPYGLLRLMACRIFSITSFGCGWFSHVKEKGT